MAKWDISVGFPDGHIHTFELDSESTVEDDVLVEAVDCLSVEADRQTVTYDVTLTLRAENVTFEYEDQDNEYDDASDIVDAIERGEIDITNWVTISDLDFEPEDVEVEEQ